MKRIILIITIILLPVATVFAQYVKHEFRIEAGGGISSLQTASDFGDSKIRFGGLAGINYNYFFSPNWGVGIGVEAALYNGRFSADKFSANIPAMDMDDETFDFRYTLNDYEDKQQMVALQIPLMVQYQTNGNKTKFYAAAGGKFALPISEKSKSSAEKLVTSGYYEENDLLLTSPYFAGFGTYTDIKKTDKERKLKNAWLVSAETGIKWRLSDKTSLYTGIYADYSLNNILPADRKNELIAYNTYSPADYQTQPAFNSSVAEKTVADKLNPLAVGLKLQLAFNCGSKKTVVVEEEPEIIGEIVVIEEPEIIEEIVVIEEPEIVEIVEPEPEKEIIIIELIVDHYSVNGFKLTPEQHKRIDEEIVIPLKRYPEFNVIVEGHTCDIGTHEANIKVGQRRANAVEAYIVSQGIEAKRIKTVSKAETEPRVPNTSEENRKKNRRVIVMMEK